MANVQHNSLTGADLHDAGPVTVDLDLTDQAADPATPASGHHAAYTKAGGLYVKDDAGAVVGPLIDAASSVSLGTPALTLGTTNAAGSGSTAVGTGATIAAFDATVPVTQALGDAAATGAAAVAARRDHKHGMPALSTATPLVESGSGAAGTGTLSSREDHVHPAGGGGMTNPMTTQDDIIVGGSAGAPGRLAKGSDSQVLTVDPTTHHLVWATPTSGFADPTTTKGDLIVHGTSTTRLGVGSDGQVLTADSTQTLGVRWAAGGGGGGGGTPAENAAALVTAYNLFR